MSTVSKFSEIKNRIKIVATKGEFTLLDEDMYQGVCVGVGYAQDVKSTFDDVERINDKIRYIFLVNNEGKWIPLKADYTVSAHEKATLPPLLDKVGLTLESFYELLGQNVRVSVGQQASKKDAKKVYNKIDKFMSIKKSDEEITTPEFVLPYFYAEEIGEYELLDGITFGEKKDDKPKRTKNITVDEVYDDEIVEEDVIEDDTDELDDFMDDM